MSGKTKTQPTDAEMKAKAIARWNNEGGAPEAGDVSVRKRPKRPRDPNQLAKSQREDKPSKVHKGSK
jgi:hypothetical protein